MGLLAKGIPAQRQKSGRGAGNKGRRAFSLEVITPIQIGEEISAGFTFFEKGEIDLSGGELLVEAIEIEQMILGPAAGIVGGAVGFDQEGPVARLGEKEFARRLFKCALNRGIAGLAITTRNFDHSAGGAV